MLLNKHQANVALLGDDYPLYCEGISSVPEKLKLLRENKHLYSEISTYCKKVTEPYRMTNVSAAIADIL